MSETGNLLVRSQNVVNIKIHIVAALPARRAGRAAKRRAGIRSVFRWGNALRSAIRELFRAVGIGETSVRPSPRISGMYKRDGAA